MPFTSKQLKSGVAALGIALAYLVAREPSLPAAERGRLASRFRFNELPLARSPVDAGAAGAASLRQVHPGVKGIEGWISAVGAGVALADLDGDGLPNDACLVDPRDDVVEVLALPPHPERRAPLRLWPDGVHATDTLAPMGCLPGDANEDGATDLVVYFWGRPPLLFLRGPEGYRPIEIVSDPSARWFSNAALFADIDGDGHPDLVVGNYFTDGARVLDPQARDRFQMQSSMSRAFNGGKKHFLRWSGVSDGALRVPHFSEQAGVLSDDLSQGWTLAMAAGDLDGDLLPELYLANDFGPDRLLHNRSVPGHFELAAVEGRRGFFTPASKVLGRDSFKGMGVDFGDADGDGFFDIYVSNIAGEFSLLESHLLFMHTRDTTAFARGIAPYEDRSEVAGVARSGWGWDVRLADFDNDGVLEAVQATGFVRGTTNRWPELQELATGNDALLSAPSSWFRMTTGDDLSGHQHNPFYVQQQGRYEDLALEVGLSSTAVSRGLAIADIEGDGDADLVIANQWDASRLVMNECNGCAASLGLHLLVPLSHTSKTRVTPGHPTRGLRARPALGAVLSVERPDGTRAVALVDGGNGHSGKRSPDVLVGLGRAGAAAQARPVTIRWRDPSGVVRTEKLRLDAGWHTVILAWPDPGAANGNR